MGGELHFLNGILRCLRFHGRYGRRLIEDQMTFCMGRERRGGNRVFKGFDLFAVFVELFIRGF